MRNWYKGLESRYSTLPKEIQILNLVSDLNKAKNMADVDHDVFKNHLFGAIILLDYIIADPKWKGKLRELLRLREAIGSLIFLEEPYGSIEQVITAALLMEPKSYKALRKPQ